MPTLDEIINIRLSMEGSQITRPGFGTALILGCSNRFTDLTRKYTSATDMVSDGFLPTDPEYKAASVYFAQDPKPTQVKIGRRTHPPTMSWKITPVAKDNTKYQILIDSQVAEYVSSATATIAEIIDGLVAAIASLNPAPALIANNQAGEFLQMVANAPGAWFQVTVNDFNLLNVEQDHADGGIESDLDAILSQDSDWYGLVNPFNSRAEVMAAASWTETNKKLFLAACQDTGIISSSVSDIASTLQVNSYARTSVWFHPDNGVFLDAGVFGACLPYDPGSETWAFKTIKGVPVVALTSSQQGYAQSKYANYYQMVSNVPITWEGKVSANEYIDVIRGCDWLKSDMQANIFDRLKNAQKVPFIDAGIANIKSAMKCSLDAALDRGFLTDNPAPTVNAPKAINAAPNERRARKLTGVKATGYFASAIHSIDPITVTLTY